jgi:hypothetical protein
VHPGSQFETMHSFQSQAASSGRRPTDAPDNVYGAAPASEPAAYFPAGDTNTMLLMSQKNAY